MIQLVVSSAVIVLILSVLLGTVVRVRIGKKINQDLQNAWKRGWSAGTAEAINGNGSAGFVCHNHAEKIYESMNNIYQKKLVELFEATLSECGFYLSNDSFGHELLSVIDRSRIEYEFMQKRMDYLYPNLKLDEKRRIIKDFVEEGHAKYWIDSFLTGCGVNGWYLKKMKFKELENTSEC